MARGEIVEQAAAVPGQECLAPDVGEIVGPGADLERVGQGHDPERPVILVEGLGGGGATFLAEDRPEAVGAEVADLLREVGEGIDGRCRVGPDLEERVTRGRSRRSATFSTSIALAPPISIRPTSSSARQ